MAELPFVDEHSVAVDAAPPVVWEALCAHWWGRPPGRAAQGFGALVGVADHELSGEPGTEGATVLGFHVARAEVPRELALVGRHRFAEYALVFRIEERGAGASTLRAETRATFPGVAGRAYRALVIGTRLHVVATRSILGAVRRRAERRAP